MSNLYNEFLKTKEIWELNKEIEFTADPITDTDIDNLIYLVEEQRNTITKLKLKSLYNAEIHADEKANEWIIEPRPNEYNFVKVEDNTVYELMVNGLWEAKHEI